MVAVLILIIVWIMADPDKMKLEDQANDDPPLARWAKIMSLGHQDFHSRDDPHYIPRDRPCDRALAKGCEKMGLILCRN